MSERLTTNAGVPVAGCFGSALPDSSAEARGAAGGRFTRVLLWLAEAVPLRFVSL